LGFHLFWEQGAGGSNPSAPTNSIDIPNGCVIHYHGEPVAKLRSSHKRVSGRSGEWTAFATAHRCNVGDADRRGLYLRRAGIWDDGRDLVEVYGHRHLAFQEEGTQASGRRR